MQNFCVGALPVGLDPQRQNSALGIPTCWYLKTRKFALSPTRNLNVSQWNISCLGFQTQISRIGNVLLIILVLISFALGTQRKPLFQWTMDLKVWPGDIYLCPLRYCFIQTHMYTCTDIHMHVHTFSYICTQICTNRSTHTCRWVGCRGWMISLHPLPFILLCV